MNGTRRFAVLAFAFLSVSAMDTASASEIQLSKTFKTLKAPVTGRKVVFFPVQSYAAQYEAMRSGRLHVAGVNTGGNPVAVNCCSGLLASRAQWYSACAK